MTEIILIIQQLAHTLGPFTNRKSATIGKSLDTRARARAVSLNKTR